MKIPSSDVVKQTPLILNYYNTYMLKHFPGGNNSDGAKVYASETQTTKVMWKISLEEFDHTLLETFYAITL